MTKSKIVVALLVLQIVATSCYLKELSKNYENERLFRRDNHELVVDEENIINRLEIPEKECMSKCSNTKKCLSTNFYKTLQLNEFPCHLLNKTGKGIAKDDTNYIYKSESTQSWGPCTCKGGGDEVHWNCDCTSARVNGHSIHTRFKNCEEALNNTSSIPGLYNIKPDGITSIDVFCHKMKEGEHGCNFVVGDVNSAKYVGISEMENKDKCVKYCSKLTDGNGIQYNFSTIDSRGARYRVNYCYCEYNVLMDSADSNSELETCYITKHLLEDVTWTTVLQIVESQLYFSFLSLYKESYGSLTGNYWLGLNNIYHLTAAFNLTLRIEYFLENFDKIIMEYTNFKLLDNEIFQMTYAGYNPIRTNADVNDNMRCRKWQPFFVTEGAWWGVSNIKITPFYNEGMFWGTSEGIKKMKMSFKKYSMCDHIEGQYAKSDKGYSYAIIEVKNRKISGRFFYDRLPFHGLVESENGNDCFGYMIIDNKFDQPYQFRFNVGDCKLHWGVGGYWTKLFCYPTINAKNCIDVKQNKCPNGDYMFSGSISSCYNGFQL